MTTDKSRADALTDLQREAIKFAAAWFDQSVLPDTPYSRYANALRELLAASPVPVELTGRAVCLPAHHHLPLHWFNSLLRERFAA